ncbi:hypothetical protein ACIBQX_17285, partial [Nonomuraea sp. NPDC049714]|uniref:hypothetical protein n=1 Tax=Nonomuraea sp. NPDC049714 TaxID=3364357 RepID=UPI0037B6A512
PADAVLLTPAHQYPTGVVLSPARRAALMEWARPSTLSIHQAPVQRLGPELTEMTTGWRGASMMGRQLSNSPSRPEGRVRRRWG